MLYPRMKKTGGRGAWHQSTGLCAKGGRLCDREPTPGTDFARRNPGTEGTAFEAGRSAGEQSGNRRDIKTGQWGTSVGISIVGKDRWEIPMSAIWNQCNSWKGEKRSGCIDWMSQVYTWKSPKKLRIGLAKDEAFCFFYEDNLDLLRSMGAELVAFFACTWRTFTRKSGRTSSLWWISGIKWKSIGGESFYAAGNCGSIKDGMPCLAECGGFMYLHEKHGGNGWEILWNGRRYSG